MFNKKTIDICNLSLNLTKNYYMDIYKYRTKLFKMTVFNMVFESAYSVAHFIKQKRRYKLYLLMCCKKNGTLPFILFKSLLLL